MADTKISALSELAASPHLDDEFVVVDKSDTSMAASGTDKRITGRRLLVPQRASLPTGWLFDTFDRVGATGANNIALTSGTLKMAAIWLPEGLSVASVNFVSGGTALTRGTGSHSWGALFDSSLALLRQSTDDTASAWANNAAKAFALSSAFVTTYTGMHFLGLLVVAGSGGTQPNLSGVTQGAGIAGVAPAMAGNSTTGLTTTAPNPAGAITAASNPYAGVS